MVHVISELIERLALPPDGVDLRGELVALQKARIRQALATAGGDRTRAARLLGMSRLDLARLEDRLGAAGAADSGEPLGQHVPRIAAGVELISAAVVRRYAAEGLDERTIANRVGCNVFIVEKILREQTANEIVRLDRVEKLAPRAIADRLHLPISRVRAVLSAADAKPRPE